MKLNYNVDKDKIKKPADEKSENGFEPKNKTKLSMQSTVMGALSSKQPTGGGGMSMPVQNGWGASN